MDAKNATVGCCYETSTGIVIQVVSKETDAVIVKSCKTGNVIRVALNYLLIKEVNSEDTASMTNKNETVTPETPVVKEKRGKKSVIIDEGLKQNLTTDEVVQKVLAVYPDFPEKNIRNLVSVRRSKLKKASA